MSVPFLTLWFISRLWQCYVFRNSGWSLSHDYVRCADPGQPPPTEEMPAVEETPSISCDIYNHHMLLEGHGLPLYIPQPSTSHCHSYLHRGVSIGDVGVVTPLGDFDHFFNICLPVGHTMNPDVLPKGFYPLDLKPAQIRVDSIYAHPSDSYIASPSVQRTRLVTNPYCVSNMLIKAVSEQPFIVLNLKVLF